MDDSAASVCQTEDEIKASDDVKPEINEAEKDTEKENQETLNSNPIQTIDSFVESLVEEVSQEAKSLVENVIPSSSDVTNVEKEVEKIVLESEPLAYLKSFAAPAKNQTPESSEPLPTSDEKVSETAQQSCNEKQPEKEDLDLEEKSRGIKTQPFVAVASGSRASWTNCCGLLDVFFRSNQ